MGVADLATTSERRNAHHPNAVHGLLARNTGQAHGDNVNLIPELHEGSGKVEGRRATAGAQWRKLIVEHQDTHEGRPLLLGRERRMGGGGGTRAALTYRERRGPAVLWR